MIGFDTPTFHGGAQRQQSFWDFLHEQTQYEKEPNFTVWSN